MTHNVVPGLFFFFSVAQLAGKRERETGNKVEQRRADERDWNKFDKEEQSYQYQFPRMVAALSQEYIPLNLYRVFTFSFILVTALSENP